VKPEKWISCLLGVGLAFVLSFGALGCLISAFELEMSFAALAFGCGLVSLLGCCYLLKRGDALVVCLTALVLGYLWRRGTLITSVETLAYALSVRYDGGYGWGILGKPSGTVDAAVLLLAADIALTTVRCVCRRDTAFTALTFALVPLLACMVVTDTVPGVPYLTALLGGMLVLLLTAGLRRSDPSQANTLTAMAVVPVAVLMGVLLWAAPKESYVNKTEEIRDTLILWAASVPEMLEDLTADEELVEENDDRLQEVDLSKQGPRKLFTYSVMEVTAQTGGTLYLRERDYDAYSGTGWTNSLGRSDTFARNDALPWENAGTVHIVTNRVRRVVYYPYYAEEPLNLVGGCVGNVEERSEYTVNRYVLPENWRELTGSTGEPQLLFPVGDAATEALQRYGKLPADTRKWAEDLVKTVIGNTKTDTEKADAIAAFVRRSAEYDLETRRMPEDRTDFARWFLEESDTGYCVHFATAAAVLLRAAGVESRYVTGYLVTVEAGQTATVTAERSHAWVEYYDSALRTWIVLEATPAMAGLTGDGEIPTEETDPDETEPGATEPDMLPSETEDPTGEAPVEDPEADDGGEPAGKRGWLLLTLLPLLLFLQSRVRMELRRRRLRRGDPNGRALALWQEAELFCRVLKMPPPDPLRTLAEKAKYSPHTLTAQELLIFESWLRDAARQKKAKPWYIRLLWRWAYAI
jgi:transglutaminase-like putative cysteine protease